MEWSNQDIEKLCELWQENECLWNVRVKEYHDRKERNKALSVIAVEMRIDGKFTIYKQCLSYFIVVIIKHLSVFHQ